MSKFAGYFTNGKAFVDYKGDKGDPGKSAYEVAVENGYEGTEEDWTNEHLSPEGYYNKNTVDNKILSEAATRAGADSNLQSKIEVERERINNLSRLEEGSTTGDAELIDIRIDDEGNTHSNAGESVRFQSNALNKKIINLGLTNIKNQEIDLSNFIIFEQGSIDPTTGNKLIAKNRIRSNFLYIKNLIKLEVVGNDNFNITYDFYDKNYNMVRKHDSGIWTDTSKILNIKFDDDIYFIKFVVKKSDDTNIIPEDFTSSNILIRGFTEKKINNISENSNYDFCIEEGSFDSQSGAEIYSGYSRIRSKMLAIGKGSSIKLKTSSLKMCLYKYDILSKEYIENITWTSNPIELDADYNVRLLIRKSTDTVFTSEEIDEIKNNLFNYIDIDFYFPNSIINKLLENTDEIKNNVNNLMYTEPYSSDINLKNLIIFERGSINPTTGDKLNVAHRIRSDFLYIKKINKIIINANENYKITYDFYDKNYNMVRKHDSGIWTTSKIIDLKNDEDLYFIKFVAANQDDSNIPCSEIEDVVNELTLVGSNTVENDLPNYFENQLNLAINNSKNNIFSAGINGESFIFITDLHWQSNSKKSPILIKEIVKKLNINKIICGGDLIGGGNKQTNIDLMNDCVNSFKDISKFYVLLGNHDRNTIGSTSSDYFTNSESYALMQKQMDDYVDYETPCYFSFDNKATKTRFICIDSGLENTTISQEQIQWFIDTLNSTPNGYKILLFSHIVYQSRSWSHSQTESELINNLYLSTQWQSLVTICDDFNTNNDSKKIIAIFGGHVHVDTNFLTAGGIPIILTDCDTRQTFSDVGNEANTINEQCFDIVTIDYNNRKIYCIRIGRGNDREFSY